MGELDRKFVQLAIDQAMKSAKQGGFPAGAVAVKNGKIISKGISIGFRSYDTSGHAETSAIRKACKALKTSDLTGATLYESLECCNMCFSIAYLAGISRIVFACRKMPRMVRKNYYEGNTDNEILNKNNNRKIELIFASDFEKESLDVVRQWERSGGFGRKIANA